jgi:hypothetical protein
MLSMDLGYGLTSVPTCYIQEIEELPSLVQSAPTSNAATPIFPPASLCNRTIDPIIDYSDSTPPPIDPRLDSWYDPTLDYMPRPSSVASLQSSPRSDSDVSLEMDQETAFLLRHFSKGPGYWMDLFDRGTYFTSYVPIAACENLILKYAAIACAAKALAQVQGRNPVMGRNISRQPHVDLYPDASSVDWKHKAVVFYDHAVSMLLQAVKNDTNAAPDASDCELRQQNGAPGYAFEGQAPKRRRTSSNANLVPNPDDLLAASAMLCVYELLDSSIPEWAGHLNGAKSLLVLTQERMKPLQMPSPGSPVSSVAYNFMTKARRATFWNIARQDMFASCKYSRS